MAIASSGHGQKLSRQQEQTIAALLACPSIQAAASQAGVAEKTVYRWLKEPAFATAYREARTAILEHAIVQVQQHTSTAVLTLRDVMQDTEGSSSARVSAARTVLELAFKILEVESLEQRIAELEDQLAGLRL
jgi:transposase